MTKNNGDSSARAWIKLDFIKIKNLFSLKNLVNKVNAHMADLKISFILPNTDEMLDT